MLSQCKIIALIPTTDAARARSFYETMLGLRFLYDDNFALVFDANGITIRVVKMPDFKAQPFTVMGWEVADIVSEAAELLKRGIAFERYGWFEQDEIGIWTAPNGSRVAWFKDPDSNVLSISQHSAV